MAKGLPTVSSFLGKYDVLYSIFNPVYDSRISTFQSAYFAHPYASTVSTNEMYGSCDILTRSTQNRNEKSRTRANKNSLAIFVPFSISNFDQIEVNHKNVA